MLASVSQYHTGMLQYDFTFAAICGSWREWSILQSREYQLSVLENHKTHAAAAGIQR